MKKFGKFLPKGHILSEALQRRLNVYALTAGAAGVSLLAMAQPSSAEIIYTATNRTLTKDATLYLDLNHDKTIDLVIENRFQEFCNIFGSCRTYASLVALPQGTNELVYNVFGAVAMKSGMGIGPRDAFKGGNGLMAEGINSGTHVSGTWVNVANRYLGLKFTINGQTHYGWVRMTVQTQGGDTITATVTGYAYECLPNTPITAGKTSGASVAESSNDATGTLGSLALGKR